MRVRGARDAVTGKIRVRALVGLAAAVLAVVTTLLGGVVRYLV